jgi:hypothetical protein
MSGGDRLSTFQASLNADAPPGYAHGPLEAHWNVGKGRLARALELIENDASRDAAWVRAHLHRRKGEDAEAEKWYGKAGRSPSGFAPDPEWDEIAGALLLHV